MNAFPARILRSPLFHFALVGVLLFALASFLELDLGLGSGADRADDPAKIRVERDALLAFVQAQTGMARIEDAANAFDTAAEAVRRDWIERFVREEALVREARLLGLDRSDELIRRRLVQQMEFLVEGAGKNAYSVSDAEIEAAYRTRSREFRHPATFRFAHVFTREFEGYEDRAPERAIAIRDAMNEKKVPFEEGYPYGDRFLYDRSYVDRSLDEIRSHFGDAFAKTLETLEPTPGRWTGPYRSEHGLHLLMLVAKQPARNSSLEEVREELREALLREKRDRAVEQGVAALVSKYAVVCGEGLRGPECSADSRRNIAPPPDS
ncbi:peptidyl-prolyl cis-trans isomerase [Myxococcota bacterium]|nr:peptidyl-prolyl cis-trans isomerase [Myxococcota bacterium]